MEAFESVVALTLEAEKFVVSGAVKFPVTRRPPAKRSARPAVPLTWSSSFPIAEPRSHATIALLPTRLSVRDDRQKAASERLALLPSIGPHRFVTATASSA